MSENPRTGFLNSGDVEDISDRVDSMLSLGMGELDAEHGVVLKDWSAQDFANIYVRFRPHLLVYARKFVKDEGQAEEIVQDAFLYLMTSLPELDSEMGVLRFLKWKVRGLSIDILRKLQRGPNNIISAEFSDLEDANSEVSLRLERADEAALVTMALSKLENRQREALLATVYEERTSSDVAKQMGLTENAFRQLVYRARKAFRVALVGELDVRGMQTSEILGIAVRKASGSAKLTTSFVLALLLLAPIVSISGWGNKSESAPLAIIAPLEDSKENLALQAPPEANTNYSADSTIEASLDVSAESRGTDPEERTDVIPSETVATTSLVQAASTLNESRKEGKGHSELVDNLSIGFLESMNSSDSRVLLQDQFIIGGSSAVQFENSAGLSATVGFSIDGLGTIRAEYVWLRFRNDQFDLIAVPTVISLSQIELGGSSQAIELVAGGLVVGDVSGNFDGIVTDESIAFVNASLISFELSPDGNVEKPSIALSTRASDKLGFES